MRQRYVGIDVGAEAIKVVVLEREGQALRWIDRRLIDHDKHPGPRLLELLASLSWSETTAAACTGRLGRPLRLPRVPTRQAQSMGFRFLVDDQPATVVSIGSHGFSVLELQGTTRTDTRPGMEVDAFRENARCSQGTGNFLRQLVERFSLSIAEACTLAEDVEEAAPLSGRCPVILKTDMTHLANKGEDRRRILAGLFDAVCENVQVLIKPRVSPPRVALVGGVSRSARVRAHFQRFLARHEMTLLELGPEDGLFLDALGCAVFASTQPAKALPGLEGLLAPPEPAHLERVPGLAASLGKVKRLPPPVPPTLGEGPLELILGFDIGSTGSKAVALEVGSQALVWESYLQTGGNPVGAAQALVKRFLESALAGSQVVMAGATGSGREIVGSLLATCFGPPAVLVMNEIAAHAEGALRYDRTVDTIFEIGGQDAKYIHLSEGRVVDAAMNEACSAGTGSFIEEQGRRFQGIRDVVQLGQEACKAQEGVSLGQHCSVFMAEIMDEAVAAGVEQPAIIAGIYDSIVQNYLNRVKGSRPVGKVIFCQGMPFASDALAAAVARQTGAAVIVPPNPGTVGALGIALLALKELGRRSPSRLYLQRFLEAQVVSKDTFICKSTVGCGGSGNRCRIDRLTTLVPPKGAPEGHLEAVSAGFSSLAAQALGATPDPKTVGSVVEGAVKPTRRIFTWGGACSLYDGGIGRGKLPDRSPDPFREREELIADVVLRVSTPRGGKRIALSNEFMMNGLFPFFATYLYELGFDLSVFSGADQASLKRGIEEANVPFCAPMQQFHGLASQMAESKPDYLFLPMLRSIPRQGVESNARVCPIVQGSPDILKWDLGERARAALLSPVIDVGDGNLDSKELRLSCYRLARSLGLKDEGWLLAWKEAVKVQRAFDFRCQQLGKRALEFCQERDIPAVVVLGRIYTIYNRILNSNVPAILREQGAVAIPVDCYPIDQRVPIFDDIYWGYGQHNLRAAHQIRRTPGVWSIFCSNYSCGPDSFSLHFYSYIMEGRPFSVIETDGHAGDAGTRTRVEAFLHCVEEERRSGGQGKRPHSFKRIELDKENLREIKRKNELVLVPRMGPGADVLAACLRGTGVRAEALPMPDRESLRLGRRYTSGKECVPMTLTLGSLLKRIEADSSGQEQFSFFMPTSQGPCRFGVYNLLHKITLERLDVKDRVGIWSPDDGGYFVGVPGGFAALVFAGFMAADLLLEALYYVRPVERREGAARAIYAEFHRALDRLLEKAAAGDLSIPTVGLEVASGRLFGVAELLRQAGTAFAAEMRPDEVPTVLVVGEIYVRCDPFAHDFVIDRLEDRGIRVRFAPFNEWLEYTDQLSLSVGRRQGMSARLSSFVQGQIQSQTYNIIAKCLGWPKRTSVKDSLEAVKPYLRDELHGEAVLTVGGPVHEWREGMIDAVLSVGPLECMPNKIAESQFYHVTRQEGLLSLTLSLNGDPVDPEILDNFAFDVRRRFAGRKGAGADLEPARRPGKGGRSVNFEV